LITRISNWLEESKALSLVATPRVPHSLYWHSDIDIWQNIAKMAARVTATTHSILQYLRAQSTPAPEPAASLSD
jgi:hypothetical protein